MPEIGKVNFNFIDSVNHNKECYEIIFKIENVLRFFIFKEMSKENTRWWKTLSDARLKEKVHDRLQKERQRSGADYILMHEIYFTDMEDLYKIMSDNWAVFKNHFGTNKQDFNSDFDRIIFIRNRVMHSRPIVDAHKEFLGHFLENNLKKKTGIDKESKIEFLSAYNEKDIKDKFLNELKSHKTSIENGNINTFNTETYDSINSEWWYNDYIDIDTDICYKYYNDLNHVNKIISNNERGAFFKIQRMIKSKEILNRSNQIIERLSE